ncbi:glycosyl transferase [Bacillus pseudomycoides]|nr:glycosyl transferase [Bacillus pseudomycoides]
MAPKVSIVVPVYNSEKYLSECLESILNQTYTNIEVVIINDGSTDQSEKIVNKYKMKDDRIAYYYQDNCGPSEARNKGILNSTGEYLTFIDSDDTVEKYYIEFLLNKMISSDADLVCCGYKDISEYGVLNCIDFNFNTNVSLYSFIDMVCKGTGGVLWGKIYKKEIIINSDLKLDKNIFMCEDLVFVLQYASQCQYFSSIKEPLYNYNRCNQNSISSNISISYIQNYITVCKRIDEIFISINLGEQKINEIITKRIQDLVMTLVEKQSIEIRVIGMKNAIANIMRILSIPYIKTHIGEFSTNSIFYKPYIFLIKNRLIRTSIIYGIYLNTLRNVKRRIKIGKQVRA